MGRMALCRWRGSGTVLDPFVPDIEADGRWGVFDLRADVSVADGFGFVYSPDATTLGARIERDLGDDLDSPLGPLLTQVLENRLGVTLDNRDPRRILRKLMLEGGGSGRWNPIRAEAGRWYRGWMAGELLFEVPQVGGGALYTDNFTRADGTTIGNLLSWTELRGNAETSGNRVRPVTSNNDVDCRADSDLDTDDNYAQAVIEFTSGSHNWWVMCRYSSSAVTGYMNIGNTNSVEGLRLFRVVGGGSTQIGSSQTVSTSANTPFTVKVTADGSSITGVTNGTSYGPQTDSNITTGKRGGIGFYTGSPTTIYLDDFEMGDTVQGHPAAKRYMGLPFFAGPRSSVRRS